MRTNHGVHGAHGVTQIPLRELRELRELRVLRGKFRLVAALLLCALRVLRGWKIVASVNDFG